MLIFRGLSAVGAAALGAAAILALPGFSPEVSASAPAPVVKSDRLDLRPAGKACTQQAWPYYEAACLRDRSRVGSKARSVRLVSIDQIAAR
jgi:hypothetical protein